MILSPSVMDRVARSHSASTSTSPVPRASIAFSSSGRPLVLLPDAFSVKMVAQRVLRSAAICRSRFWCCVETRA